MTPQWLPRDYIAGAKVLHVSGISQAISESACDTVFQAIAIARASGVTVSYDTNLRLKLWPLERARAITHAAMRDCDIALAGLDDAVHLTGLGRSGRHRRLLLELGAGTVALTLGKAGTLVATPQRRERIPVREVDAIDATAAGDTFDGAFLAELIEGRDPFEAARYANAAAALSTLGYGAVAPMPSREAVRLSLRATRPRRDPQLRRDQARARSKGAKGQGAWSRSGVAQGRSCTFMLRVLSRASVMAAAVRKRMRAGKYRPHIDPPRGDRADRVLEDVAEAERSAHVEFARHDLVGHEEHAFRRQRSHLNDDAAPAHGLQRRRQRGNRPGHFERHIRLADHVTKRMPLAAGRFARSGPRRPAARPPAGDRRHR